MYADYPEILKEMVCFENFKEYNVKLENNNILLEMQYTHKTTK